MSEWDKEYILQALSDIETVANDLNEGNIPPDDYDKIIENVELIRALIKWVNKLWMLCPNKTEHLL